MNKVRIKVALIKILSKGEFYKMLKDVKNKAGEVIGQYTPVEVVEMEYKDNTFISDCIDRAGTALTKTVSVTKKSILQLAVKQVNTDIRNYVAGLAREKKDSKLAVLKDYIRSQGVDVDLPLEELKKALGVK